MQDAFHTQDQVVAGGFDPSAVLVAYYVGCMLWKSSKATPKALIKTEISNYRSFETVFPFNG
jgi:hypothetical protein